MRKEIRYDRWIIIETSCGTVAIPQDCVGKQCTFTASDVEDYIEGTFFSAELFDGYGARMTMPGYLDGTEWAVFPTEEQADEFLCSMYLDNYGNNAD